MENNYPYRSNAFLALLILLLGLRISSYFTLFPDSVALTQVTKTGLRLLLTATAFFLFKKLQYKHRGHQIRLQNLTPLGLYLGYLLLGLLSLLWTSLLHYSMLQWAMVAETLVFAWFFYQLVVFYNAISGGHARFPLLFGRATLWICLAFLAGLSFNPDTFFRETHGGEISRLGGFIINPNELGMLAVVGGVMGYAELLDKRPKTINLLLLAVSVAVLLLTQSRSALLAFLLVSIYFVLRTKNVRFILGSIVLAALTVPLLLPTIVVKAGNLEEVFSLTGRLPFWRDLIVDGFTQEPLLGYGFMCISYSDYFDSIHAYSAKMTHNTFVQVLLNLGLVGAVLVLLQMVATFSAIARSLDQKTKGLAVMMLIPVLINSFTEFGIFGESNYGILFYHFILLFFVVSCEAKPQQKRAFEPLAKPPQTALA